jgi:hypothetical protein
MDPLLKQLLLSFENKNSVTAALPLRLLSTDHNKYIHNDILVGYSNGIVNWFRESKAISMTESSKQFLQEIPLFHGHSENLEEGMNSPKSTSSEMQTPIESNLSKNMNTPKNLEQKPTGQDKINESTVIAKTDISQALAKNKTTENPDISISHKIEIKSLLFDGIACFCYYQIQLKSDAYNTNKSSPKHNLNMKLKHAKYQQHAIIGLASGSCFLVSFDEIETPVRVSPDTHNHGGVLALALKGSPNSANQDIVSEFDMKALFIDVYMSTYIYIYMYILIYIRTYIFMSIYINVNICMYKYVNVHTYVYIYIYIYIYIYL